MPAIELEQQRTNPVEVSQRVQELREQTDGDFGDPQALLMSRRIKTWCCFRQEELA